MLKMKFDEIDQEALLSILLFLIGILEKKLQLYTVLDWLAQVLDILLEIIECMILVTLTDLYMKCQVSGIRNKAEFLIFWDTGILKYILVPWKEACAVEEKGL